MSRWSGVPNRSTQVHIWEGVVGNTPCNDRMVIPGIRPSVCIGQCLLANSHASVNLSLNDIT